MTLTWSKGQPVGGGPTIPTILNCWLPDDEEYQGRQKDHFIGGLFGYVPVTLVRADDQIFPDLGSGPMRTVVMAGTAWRGHDHVIEVEHDPDIEPGRAKDETRHDPTERIFARRPAYDAGGAGLNRIELELPADLDGYGKRIDAAQRGMPAHRIAALATALWDFRPRTRTSSEPAPSEPFAEEVGLGSRRGDVDWLGRYREFSPDADMGVWESRTVPPTPRGPASHPEPSRSV